MLLVELPFGFAGRLFRSPMPFSDFDPDDNLLSLYQRQGIGAVVLLVDDENCMAQSGRDLRQLYAERGMQVIHLPIPDFHVPESRALEDSIQATINLACQGKDFVVHCYAGLGRTGMFLACLARRALGMPADEAIDWVRSYVPGAIETSAQVQVIYEFQEGNQGC